jgi:putative lipoprotein (rSAM/lipoprotein system)
MATWTLKGTVQDSASGTALSGLLVTVQDTDSEEHHVDSARTDAQGSYSLTHTDLYFDHPVRLQLRDTFGTHQAKDTLILLTSKELSGGDGHGNMGTAVHTVDVKLSRKP